MPSGTPSPTAPSPPEEGGPTPGPVTTPAPAGDGWRYAYVGERPDAVLTDVVTTGPATGWAAGAQDGRLLLLRLEAGVWREARLAASGEDDVWLLTSGPSDAAGATVFHRTAGAWTPMPGLPLDDSGLAVTDVASLGPREVWTVDGGEVAARWDGTAWHRVRLPARAVSLSAAAPGRLWAVGHRPTGRQGTQPAAMLWEGQEWRLLPTPVYRFPRPVPPGATAGLTEVLALAGTEVWAVGEQTFDHGESEEEPADPPPILLRWDGTRWTKREAPATRHCCADLGSSDGRLVLATGGPGLKSTWTLDPAGRLRALPRPVRRTPLPVLRPPRPVLGPGSRLGDRRDLGRRRLLAPRGHRPPPLTPPYPKVNTRTETCRCFRPVRRRMARMADMRVLPIAPEVAGELRITDDAGRPPRQVANAEGGAPLRCCLRRSLPGEPIVLVSYAPLRRWAAAGDADPGPYDELGPVFVHASPCEGPGPGYPGHMGGERRVFRAYGHHGGILGGRFVADHLSTDEDAAMAVLAEQFRDPEVALIHVRAVEYGCFLFEVRR
jgi:hypothetical protein